jgi:hypothetical protein
MDGRILLASLWRSAIVGLVIAIVFIAIAGIEMMCAPDKSIEPLYIVGTILGLIVAVAVWPKIANFHCTYGRPITLKDCFVPPL